MTARPGDHDDPPIRASSKNIKAAENLQEALIEFLAKQLPGKQAEAESKVLVVTSSPKHEQNVLKLQTVDDPTNPLSGLCPCRCSPRAGTSSTSFRFTRTRRGRSTPSCSSLRSSAAGCADPAASNQSRACSSSTTKVGAGGGGTRRRGARPGDDHRAAAKRRSSIQHFDLHELTYNDVPTGIQAKQVGKPREIKNLNLRPQRDAPESTEFSSVSDAQQKIVLTTLVRETYYPLAEVVADVRQRMLLHDTLTRGNLAKAYPKKRVEALIRDALKRLKVKGTAVSQENRQLIMSAFGSLRQKTTAPAPSGRRSRPGSR